MMGVPKQPILEARQIVKKFPGQTALDKVDFDLRAGEVHALIGENGAGKSTLIKIIAGVYRADAGEIFIEGQKQVIQNTTDSRNLGLGFVYQDLTLVPHLSVAENIFLGTYPTNRLGFVKHAVLPDMVRQIPDALEMDVDLKKPVEELSLIQKWKVAINRALALKSRIIFMDEPTAAMTQEEVDQLFELIRHLAGNGKAIVYVSHRLEEIFSIADRVTVLKDAKKVETADLKEVNAENIYQLMLGRDFKDVFPKKHTFQEDKLLDIKNLSRGSSVRDVSFTLSKGEVICIAGRAGSGRTDLARLIFGADKKDRGEIYVAGKKKIINCPTDAIAENIALVPEERHIEGLILPMDVKQNITIASLRKLFRWNRIPFLSKKNEQALVHPLVKKTAIKASSLAQEAQYLSGGNQQKVVLAKWLCSGAKIMIFNEPTRGIDIGAKFAIYQLIHDLARIGVGVIVISSEITEIVGLAHRVLIMESGTIKAELQGDEASLDSVVQQLFA
ncbi:MAG: sugar ABC transporter ATP-binding protein [bacterium]|nr:sugar ABC transporter ATP-binding protein [bacterium]